MAESSYGAAWEADWGKCVRCGCRRPLKELLKGVACGDIKFCNSVFRNNALDEFFAANGLDRFNWLPK